MFTQNFSYFAQIIFITKLNIRFTVRSISAIFVMAYYAVLFCFKRIKQS